MTLYQPLPQAGEFLYINSASQKLCTYLQTDKHLLVNQRIHHRSIGSYKKADTKPRSLG